uniref:EGF-like domain-containing protein n=1 Tax=Gongylonema pulchrum TaxID=637853 RepID=A0A183EER4_9BILA
LFFFFSCNYGWTGEKCDIEDPCYRHSCSPGSLCVAIPIEQREEYSLGYTSAVQCIQADFGLCVNHQCKHDAQCYPCDESDEKNLQLCTEEEKQTGFRCLCPPGLLPPFCEKEADACHKHQCQNGATCAVDPENEFNYLLDESLLLATYPENF